MVYVAGIVGFLIGVIIGFSMKIQSKTVGALVITCDDEGPASMFLQAHEPLESISKDSFATLRVKRITTRR